MSIMLFAGNDGNIKARSEHPELGLTWAIRINFSITLTLSSRSVVFKISDVTQWHVYIEGKTIDKR